ncbi:phage tail protein [Pelosinus sp. IPA-1]|uniref:phage tail protein n=1 Tax=Pelosinus sp. IPA-1 TaxID=3029569 RepID=UPI0024362196|nr:phage tail protein [Pelosinus sp. IPA-1]GMB00443.1 hypothetical protein PIPA1_32420 [Pelosinus sp. IPA-1]
MSIGVISGATPTEKIEIAFEVYFQSATQTNSALTEMIASKAGAVGLTNAYNTVLNASNTAAGSKDKNRVMTFTQFQRSADGRWATHEIIGQRKPILEFLGPGLETISFNVMLMTSLGADPLTEAKKFRKLRDAGAVCDFVLGNAPVGENKWVVQKVSEAHSHFDGKGNVIVADLSLTLSEYIADPDGGAI